MKPNKLLSEIVNDGAATDIRKLWERTEAAGEYGPLPNGEYVAQIVDGELTTSSQGTPEYKLTFRVLKGEHKGKLFWHDIYLTEKALPLAKRDLTKLGVTELEQLERPLPPGIRCRVQLVQHTDDNGAKQNRVRQFNVEGRDEPEQDAFAPSDVNGEGGSDG